MFAIVLIFSVYLYIGWDDIEESSSSELEVNLPVISWGKYTNLSKQYKGDTL